MLKRQCEFSALYITVINNLLTGMVLKLIENSVIQISSLFIQTSGGLT